MQRRPDSTSALSPLLSRSNTLALVAYVRLRAGLTPRAPSATALSLSGALREVEDFVALASDASYRERAPALETLLRTASAPQQTFRPRHPAEFVGQAFLDMSASEDVWRYGVPYRWLAEHLESPILSLPQDLPGHARIGLGPHAGAAAISEAALLDDAHLLLEQTNLAYNRMTVEAEGHAPHQSDTEKIALHGKLSILNGSVATYARLTVTTSAAFVEAFVNSVGASEAAKKPSDAAAVLEQLGGQRNGRYLSLEHKLERFPGLIRTDAVSPHKVIDAAQRKEPFRRFLAESKDVRDASLHAAPHKTGIICPPQQWVTRAEQAVNDALEVAKTFWLACYPFSGYPRYLYELDASIFTTRAQSRLAILMAPR